MKHDIFLTQCDLGTFDRKNMNDNRPRWLRGVLAVLTGWWFFWLCLIILLAATIGLADLLIPGDGLSPWPGGILALIALILAIVSTIKIVKWQDRYLGRRATKTSYFIFVILVLLSILFLPIPFIFTVF